MIKGWVLRDYLLAAAILYCVILAVILAVGADWSNWTLYAR